MVKLKKRKCQRDKIRNIECANTADPVAFKPIPMEVVIDEEVSTDENTIFAHWASEFKGLLTPPAMDEEKKAHLDHITQSNRRRENGEANVNESINTAFTLEEVTKLVNHAKQGKAPSVDSIIYETLKNNAAIHALVKLFNLCLDSSLVPTVWSKALICPIPKSSSADPRVPLNYRGISLLPVTSKLYTAGINARMSKYFF